MNAKRMLVAGILALEMSAPLASHAASTPRPAPDSETTASDESALVTQPRRDPEMVEQCRIAHSLGYKEALREKNRGGSGLDVFEAYNRKSCRDPDTGLMVLCFTLTNKLANALANRGASGDLVLDLLQENDDQCD